MMPLRMGLYYAHWHKAFDFLLKEVFSHEPNPHVKDRVVDANRP
jgi:hypothetical protein